MPATTRSLGAWTKCSSSSGFGEKATRARRRSRVDSNGGSTSLSASSATPELLFLDEPTTGFDPTARRGAWELVDRLRDEGATIILTTHYMDEAQHLADRVVVINQGEIVASGTPETIGGRAEAAVRIRFGLPADVDRRLDADGGHAVTVMASTSSRRPTRCACLHALTSWALDRGIDLVGLTVDRPSLEDVYIELTSAEVTE